MEEISEAEILKRLEENPNDPDALYNIGLIRFREGRQAEAEALWRTAIGHDPAHYKSLFGMGFIRYSQELWQEAADYFRQLPGPLQPHKLGQLKEAEAALREALRLNSTDGVSLPSLANVLEDMDRYLEAEALRLEPGSTDYLYDLAVCPYNHGRHKKAEGVFRQMLGIDPQNQDVAEKIRIVLLDLARYEEVEKNQDDPEARHGFALILRCLGKYDEARTDTMRTLGTGRVLRDQRSSLRA